MVSKFRDFFFMKKNIGIQGIKGSFHHIVANNYFEENINLIEYLSFEELILNLFNDKIDYAIMAIENSTQSLYQSLIMVKMIFLILMYLSRLMVAQL